MADSPWSVKGNGRRMNRAVRPKAAQAENPPPSPSDSVGVQKAAEAGSPGAGTLDLNTAARSKRAGRKSKRSVNKAVIVIFVVLALAALAAGLTYSHENNRLKALTAQREEEARRIQAHKDEHINARRRSGYLPLIRKYANEYGISPSFVSAVIKCESSFNPLAVSRVNARGLMQVMPDTGVWLAERLNVDDYQPDLLFKAELNIRFGAYYLSYLSNMFDGSPVMVAAAFHAGSGNVKNWALTRASDMKTITLEMIPTDDTRSYVRKVLDAYAIYYEEDIRAQ